MHNFTAIPLSVPDLCSQPKYYIRFGPKLQEGNAQISGESRALLQGVPPWSKIWRRRTALSSKGVTKMKEIRKKRAVAAAAAGRKEVTAEIL